MNTAISYDTKQSIPSSVQLIILYVTQFLCAGKVWDYSLSALDNFVFILGCLSHYCWKHYYQEKPSHSLW